MRWGRIVCCAGLACLVAMPVGAQPRWHTIASGQKGLPYFTYGKRLVELLPAFLVRNQATQGSRENLELLADGRASIGFAQADAFALARRRDADRYGGLTVVGRLTDECVSIVVRRQGPVTSLSGLGQPVGGRAPKLAVGEAGSGMAATWELFTELRPELAATEVVAIGGALALNQLSLGLLDAVGWVSDPRDLDHVLMKAVRANPELALVSLGEGLEYSLDDGTIIYARRSVGRDATWLGLLRDDAKEAVPFFGTVCTIAGVFASAEADPRLVEAVSRLLSLERRALTGGP